MTVAFAPTALPELCRLVRTRPANKTGRKYCVGKQQKEKSRAVWEENWKKKKQDFTNEKRQTLKTGQDLRHKDSEYKVV